MVWAARSPACCCCWKKPMMPVISQQHPYTCQSFHGRRISFEAGNLERVGRMEEGRSARSPTGQSHVSARPLCAHTFAIAQPSHMACLGPSAQLSSSLLLLGPGEMPAFPFSVPSAFWAPPGPSPRCINLPAGGWLAGRQCKPGGG